jgi:hypothetical protein
VLSLSKFPEVVETQNKFTRGNFIQPLRNWDLALPVSERDLSVRFNFVLNSYIRLVKKCRIELFVFIKLLKRSYASIGLWGLFYKGKDQRNRCKESFTGQDNATIGFF